jgi:hypothetical protein
MSHEPFSRTDSRRRIRISAHAVERYCLRVAPNASAADARFALEQMAVAGNLRPRPRHWTRNVSPTPGLRFLYWAELPRVCGLVLDGVLITVVTRELCRTSTAERSYDRSYDRGRRPERHQRIARRRRALDLERVA